MSTSLVKQDDGSPAFGPRAEQALVSLALDKPEHFQSVVELLTPDLFIVPAVKYVMTWIINIFTEYGVLPTRELLRDRISSNLKTSQPGWSDVMALVDRPSDHREMPVVLGDLRKWARGRVLGKLYEEDTVLAFQRGDLDRVESIFNKAANSFNTAARRFYFFEEYGALLEPGNVIRYPTGWPQLDVHLNGGPSPGEVMIYLASTNVGKCHSLESKVFEEQLSRVYSLEMADGTHVELVGYQTVQTARGDIKVCDLSAGDDVIALPASECQGNDDVPDLRVPGQNAPLELDNQPSN